MMYPFEKEIKKANGDQAELEKILNRETDREEPFWYDKVIEFANDDVYVIKSYNPPIMLLELHNSVPKPTSLLLPSNIFRLLIEVDFIIRFFPEFIYLNVPENEKLLQQNSGQAKKEKSLFMKHVRMPKILYLRMFLGEDITKCKKLRELIFQGDKNYIEKSKLREEFQEEYIRKLNKLKNKHDRTGDVDIIRNDVYEIISEIVLQENNSCFNTGVEFESGRGTGSKAVIKNESIIEKFFQTKDKKLILNILKCTTKIEYGDDIFSLMHKKIGHKLLKKYSKTISLPTLASKSGYRDFILSQFTAFKKKNKKTS